MSLKAVDYDQHQHRVYAEARAVAPDMMARWMAVFGAALPARRPLAMLDLGSGVGRFAPALAGAFGGPVYGVEPSANMRRVAEATAQAPGVTYLAGEAAAIPLPDHSVDGVLMFLSFHHFPDRVAAAREIARVLRPGGRVLLRSAFSDRLPRVWWAPFFPRWDAVHAAMFASVAETEAAFAEAGLSRLGLTEVRERYSATPEEALARLRLRGISVFEHLTEAEITEGFAALDAALARGEVEIPLDGPSDLMVLG
jgi:ubiquinone/menaquinone biosynthesis C-methylase UbiE